LLKSEIIEDRIAYFTEHACANKKIVICAVVKNAEKGFEVFKKGVKKACENFLCCQKIVYDNNSALFE
jgi:capsule polysaccharide modification protein KpsS